MGHLLRSRSTPHVAGRGGSLASVFGIIPHAGLSRASLPYLHTPASGGRMANGQQLHTPMVKTKIVATIGPASESTALLSRLAHAGADVFRLNFAHGDWAWHSSVVERVRRDVSAALRKPIAILQDLGGPK